MCHSFSLSQSPEFGASERETHVRGGLFPWHSQQVTIAAQRLSALPNTLAQPPTLN